MTRAEPECVRVRSVVAAPMASPAAPMNLKIGTWCPALSPRRRPVDYQTRTAGVTGTGREAGDMKKHGLG